MGRRKLGQLRLLLRSNIAQFSRFVYAGAHDRKGFFVPMLPLAQLAQGLLLIDLAGQVESTQSLHRHDALLSQARLR